MFKFGENDNGQNFNLKNLFYREVNDKGREWQRVLRYIYYFSIKNLNKIWSALLVNKIYSRNYKHNQKFLFQEEITKLNK